MQSLNEILNKSGTHSEAYTGGGGLWGLIPPGSVKSRVSRPRKVLSNPLERNKNVSLPPGQIPVYAALNKSLVARKRKHIKDFKNFVQSSLKISS